MKKKLISIVIPCYNEEENIPRVYKAILNEIHPLKKYIFEFIFVDNGSTDHSRKEISRIAAIDKRIRGIFLSRNFGPEASTQAGFNFSKGDAVISCSCDMQEPTSLIPIYIKKWEEGYDSVIGIYEKSDDLWLMKTLRFSFYKVMKLISNVDIPVNNTGFDLYSKNVVNAMKSLPEKYRFIRGIRAWVGFKTASVTYVRQKRKFGQSSYSLFSYLRHAERSVFGFSYLPLDMLIYSGLSLVLCSFLFIVGYILFFFLFGNPIQGAVTILVAIIFFWRYQSIGGIDYRKIYSSNYGRNKKSTYLYC